jgi:DNA (cytosine-5)-methyltransferase 1
MSNFDAIDLFAGAGGFSTGANLAGVPVLWAANHWQEAVDCHAANHPHTAHVRQDLQEADWTQVPQARVLLASPACQGFSQCGQPARMGAGGNSRPNPQAAQAKGQRDRNTAWAVLSAADTLRPEFLVIENVPDLLRWEAFDAYLGVLHAYGYATHTQIVRATTYGGAQERDRLIITARHGHAAPILEPSYGPQAATIADCLEPDTAPHHRWKPVDSKSARMRVRVQKAQNEAGSRCLWANVSESSGRPLDGHFPTSTTKSIGQWYIIDGDRMRTLSARELARSMSFPDTYVLPKQKGLAGKMIGNAIDVNMARGIVEQIVMAA